ncbi:hypothetical protein D623_10035391 [Myotis brandtii]|uniref:Uncharacterized protein n=1 Tax=Myotis brandtii TaxID=109478 RepID=S7MMT7_MYOBR|nr:hypothetical protein D623_10035391 [Myotis brandtii]
MDLCQKNETELENGENNQIPSTEETELNCTYSDERKEKNHVCCLLNISDITLEQDEKANKFVIGTGWEEAVKKSKNLLVQPEEKVLSVKKDECVACAYGLKIVEGKDGKRPFELANHLKVNCMQPFPSPMVGTNLLANPELGSLHWSLLPKKNLMCPPNPNSVHCLRTMQLLQKQKEQSYKAKFKARELRPPMNTQKCILKEAKQENRPHPLETNVFPRPLLPSLTVSRVVIPASTHRFL